MQELKQIQEENRKAIILANNPEAKSYEEALEMELGRGCEIIVWNLLGDTKLEIYDYIRPQNMASFTSSNGYYKLSDNPFLEKGELEKFELKKIIGKPLTLNRVLIALSEKCYGIDQAELTDNILIYTRPYDESAEWNLTKKTLEEQSEKTQREINKLLNEV